MKFGTHVHFGPQTINLKFFVDEMIGFQDIEGKFLKILRKLGAAPNFKTPYLLNYRSNLEK